jgi:SAM-dependent methyltransferase
MELSVAIDLIKHGVSQRLPQVWADLGAGSGLFTMALASLLQPPSKIFAIDNDQRALADLPSLYSGNKLEKVTADFTGAVLDHHFLDGILMANSLHFVKDKTNFLAHIGERLKSGGTLLIVEYDMDEPNQWVPFPVSHQTLQNLLSSCGFRGIRKLHDHPSRYNKAGLYSISASLPTATG